MGNHASKKKSRKTSSKATMTSDSMNYTTEMKSYVEACEADSMLQSFDTGLQRRTSDVISTLATTGAESRGLSLDSLKEVTVCLFEMNQKVVNVILDCKNDILKDQELIELVEDYFESSLKTLDFYSALEKGLGKARANQLLILSALQEFEDESRVKGGNGYKKTLEELRKFKDAESPFDEDFFNMSQSVYEQQLLMLEKLHHRKKKLDKKLKSTHTRRRLISVIFVSTFATIVICSVVATALAAPPAVAAAMVAASFVPLGSVGKWIDSLWKNYENVIKGQREMLSSMQSGTCLAVEDLDDIRDLIGRLEIEIRGLVKCVEFVVEYEAVGSRIVEIKTKLQLFKKNVDELGVRAHLCTTAITTARHTVLQKIIKQAALGQ